MRSALLLLLIALAARDVLAQGDSFDMPLDKKVVDLGPSPANLPGVVRVRIELSCFVYRDLVVKQFDEGEKGAAWLAIVPIRTRLRPVCSKVHSPGERVINPKEWSGYFKGVKKNLVFFDAADGDNGGMPFVIYDSGTGKRIFEDSYYEARMWNQAVEDSPFNKLRVNYTANGLVLLTYLRVVGSECDLQREAATCWERTRKKLKIKEGSAPVCNGYEDIKDRWTSAVAFPVEVSLFPKPTTKNIDGPVKCWPVD
jgi:hypothetical protein